MHDIVVFIWYSLYVTTQALCISLSLCKSLYIALYFTLMPLLQFSSFFLVQVTNPAIDPLREGLVMSLEVNIGKRRNILEIGPENASQVF